MKILVAGSNTNNSEGFCLKHKVSKLYSILNEKRLIEQFDDNHFLMVDSGAHSWNKETITQIGMKGKNSLPPPKEFYETYISFIKKHKNKSFVFVEFDVYGHLNYDYLTEKYKEIKNIDGSFQIMRVYHPILDNGSLKVLKNWIDEGQTYIGIGNDSIEYLNKIFMLTKDKVKIHGFAMTKLNLLEKYPFFSADSTTPISTVIFGLYAKEYLAVKNKKKVCKDKTIEIFHDDYERLENAIINVKKTEKYLTNLWKHKGIEWND